MEIVTKTKIKGLLPVPSQDGVRDIYALPQDKQLIVYTDRTPVYDDILDQPVPYRGVVLNQISLYWIKKFTHMVGNTLVARQPLPEEALPYASMLEGRSLIVQKLKPLPLVFRVVGNLFGDDWDEYLETSRLGTRLLAKGMKESDRLENPVLLISFAGDLSTQDVDDMQKWAQRMYGQKLFTTLEEICLSIFGVARNYALARGMIIADTKFEFSLFEGNPYIINDVMTPDSSTFWPNEGFVRGRPQPSYDKQGLYDWLQKHGWVEGQPFPKISPGILTETSKRYREIFDVMTGKIVKKGEDEDIMAAVAN